MPTKEDVFEQIVGFTLSERYMIARTLVEPLMEKARPFLNMLRAFCEDLVIKSR